MSIAWLSVSDPDQYARTILRREAAHFHQDPRPRARAYLDRFPLSPDA